MPAFTRTIGIDYSGAETPTVLRAVKLTTGIASCRLSHSAASAYLNDSMALKPRCSSMSAVRPYKKRPPQGHRDGVSS